MTKSLNIGIFNLFGFCILALGCLTILCFFSGCSAPPPAIPDIPKDHPAQKFYEFVSQNMVSDRVCRDHKGDPTIPMGEIVKGERYARSTDMVPGVFRFEEKATGKKFLGVSFLQYSGLLQIPKVCAWGDDARD